MRARPSPKVKKAEKAREWQIQEDATVEEEAQPGETVSVGMCSEVFTRKGEAVRQGTLALDIS